MVNAVLENVLQSVGPPELYERTLTRQKACYRPHILSKWCVRRDRQERLINEEHLLKYKNMFLIAQSLKPYPKSNYRYI
jgi:hypothetical protein